MQVLVCINYMCILYVHVCIYKCARMPVYVYIIYARIYMYVCLYLRMYVCVVFCVYLCVCVCVLVDVSLVDFHRISKCLCASVISMYLFGFVSRFVYK